MRKELKPYADEAFGIVETAANDIGSRLPGSEGEKKFADFMAGKLESIGVKPVKEKFLVSPRASIGGIPYAGWVGIICAVMMYFEQLYGLVFFLCLATWVWLICSVFLYKTWFDAAFHQEVSQNVYGEILPPDGKYDYTVILSAHTDTSWNWKHSSLAAKSPVPVFIKMGIGIFAFLFLTLTSLAMFIIYCKYVYATPTDLTQGEYITMMETLSNVANFKIALYVLLAVFVIPGCFLVTLWADKNPRTASPGAMDNATGIGIAFAAAKYYKENPDKMPKGCRIIDFNCGSEEAGLRGSIAFTKKHKGEAILENCYNINIDSVADKDYFEVVHGDTWQFTKFDKDLETIMLDAMKEAGIDKPGNIVNPVGGCDSTPMTKAGVKSITFAAQNPVLTQYYHTFYDVAERFDVDTVHLGLDVVLRAVDKIGELENFKRGIKAEKAAESKSEVAPVETATADSAAKEEKVYLEAEIESDEE